MFDPPQNSILDASISLPRTARKSTHSSPGSCFGRLCPAGPPSPPEDSLSSLVSDRLDPGSSPGPAAPSRKDDEAVHRSQALPAGDPALLGAAVVTEPSGAGKPGSRSAPHGSSASPSPWGLMDGEFGKVSAGPTPPAEPAGLLLLRLLEAHRPRESPEDLVQRGSRLAPGSGEAEELVSCDERGRVESLIGANCKLLCCYKKHTCVASSALSALADTCAIRQSLWSLEAW